jgi:DNA-binding PadR family transcriptional regulator
MGRDEPSETEGLIMISLADQPRHGTAILDDIAATSGRHLAVGTLYGTLDRMIGDGLVEPMAPAGRRRPYRLTPEGVAALTTYLAMADTVVRVGTRRLALG